jgi:hypothetical protein
VTAQPAAARYACRGDEYVATTVGASPRTVQTIPKYMAWAAAPGPVGGYPPSPEGPRRDDRDTGERHRTRAETADGLGPEHDAQDVARGVRGEVLDALRCEQAFTHRVPEEGVAEQQVRGGEHRERHVRPDPVP